MFRKMPFILLFLILSVILLDKFIPLELKTFLYSLSLSIKAILIFLLPIIIFGFLFKTTLNLAHNATKTILIIFAGICFSNFISTFMSHYIGSLVYQMDFTLIKPKENLMTFTPYWNLVLPKLIDNDKAMLFGLVLGALGAWIKHPLLKKTADHLANWVNKILSLFSFVIPFFVIGFVLKLQHEGIMFTIIKDYASIFILVALAQFGYILLMYFSANQFSKNATLSALKNMLPAAIAGFSTMSSASAMPLTLLGVQKNSKDPAFARAVIPATVNIHLVGDCFAIPIFAYAVLKNYGLAEPLLLDYIIFACYFVLAKFSVAGVPGGGIFVMLPILEKHLGFNAEMMSMITALYLLFDPLITSANVLGNGAFANIIERVQRIFVKDKSVIVEVEA